MNFFKSSSLNIDSAVMLEQIDQQTYAKPHAKENQCRHQPTKAKLWFYLILIIMEENTNWYADHNRDEEDP